MVSRPHFQEPPLRHASSVSSPDPHSPPPQPDLGSDDRGRGAGSPAPAACVQRSISTPGQGRFPLSCSPQAPSSPPCSHVSLFCSAAPAKLRSQTMPCQLPSESTVHPRQPCQSKRLPGPSGTPSSGKPCDTRAGAKGLGPSTFSVEAEVWEDRR